MEKNAQNLLHKKVPVHLNRDQGMVKENILFAKKKWMKQPWFPFKQSSEKLKICKHE